MSGNVPELSLVIPCYNEQDNLRELVKAIRAAVEPLKVTYEIVITDDCSTDRSWEILKELAVNDPRIRVQRLAFNCGESAAIWAGLKAARGKIFVTLDADLQNDPADLVRQAKLTEPAKVVDFLIDLFLQGDVPAPARAKLVAFVGQGQPTGKALDRRVREAAHTILCMPEYQLA